MQATHIDEFEAAAGKTGRRLPGQPAAVSNACPAQNRARSLSQRSRRTQGVKQGPVHPESVGGLIEP